MEGNGFVGKSETILGNYQRSFKRQMSNIDCANGKRDRFQPGGPKSTDYVPARHSSQDGPLTMDSSDSVAHVVCRLSRKDPLAILPLGDGLTDVPQEGKGAGPAEKLELLLQYLGPARIVHRVQAAQVAVERAMLGD